MSSITIDQALTLAFEHHGAGRLTEAEHLYRQILAQQPNHAPALQYLGVIAHQMGNHTVAVELMQRAIQIDPHCVEYHSNLGEVWRVAGMLEEAIAASRTAVQLKPDFATGYLNLGLALFDKGQFEEALAAFRQALTLKYDHPEVHFNLGNVLGVKGQLDEALAAFRQAIALKPNYSEAYNNLGNVLQSKGQLDEAVAAFRQASNLNPNDAVTRSNLGNCLKDQGQLDEAIADFRHALALQPDLAMVHSNLVLTQSYHPGYDAAAICAAAREWNQQHAEPLQHLIQPHPNDRSPERRLRLGYLSPDFHEHPVGRFLLPLLAAHDRQQYEIFAYANLLKSNLYSEKLRAHTDQWRNIDGLSDEATAALIRQDQIDILIDLAMHTAHNRLLVFARKPAPVQVAYLAYAGTTGMASMDYRLTDIYLDPPGRNDNFYTEQSYRLPETYWCYEPPCPEIAVSPLPVLKGGGIAFGSLNNFCKVTIPALAAWCRLLREVPDSRLLVHANEGSHRQRTREMFSAAGIDPGRLNFMARLPLADYFRVYADIDIMLDAFPYSGGTTTCDALWMGVPVVSLCGEPATARGGFSVLSNVGLPELAAQTPEEYVHIAAQLATDVPRLKELRSGLRQRMLDSPLMDAPRFARNVEAAYRQMWRTWCAAKPGEEKSL